jgi:hypothetical protein
MLNTILWSVMFVLAAALAFMVFKKKIIQWVKDYYVLIIQGVGVCFLSCLGVFLIACVIRLWWEILQSAWFLGDYFLWL